MRTSLAEGATPGDFVSSPGLQTMRDPGIAGRGLRGWGWEKGLSPESCGPGFQGGSGRPCRIQRWSPAADPLLTCTKSTKFMDNCQAPLLCRDSLPEVD